MSKKLLFAEYGQYIVRNQSENIFLRFPNNMGAIIFFDNSKLVLEIIEWADDKSYKTYGSIADIDYLTAKTEYLGPLFSHNKEDNAAETDEPSLVSEDQD